MIGQQVDVCGYEYTVHSKASLQPDKGKHSALRWIAFRAADNGSTVWAIIQRQTIKKERRWAVVRQIPAPKGAS